MGKMIVKHNVAIRAAYRMSLNEQRMMLMCIAQIKRNESNSRAFTVSHSDFCEQFDTSGAYKDMKDAARRLQQRIITINDAIVDEDGTRWEGGCISLLSAQYWSEGQGKIQLRFAPEFMPYLEHLSKNFTKYMLSDVKKMSSAYAIHFYEIFKCQYEQQKTNAKEPSITMEVGEIRMMFDIEKKYKAHKDFKKRVIDHAIEEINKYSPLLVEYTQIKNGRSIHAYVFTISRKAESFALKPTKNRNAVKEATQRIKEAVKTGFCVTLLGKEVLEINGSIVSYKNNTAANLYAALVEADCHFEVC